MFFIRNITFGFILFALLVTGTFVFIAHQVFSNTLEQYVVSERVQQVRTVVPAIFAAEDTRSRSAMAAHAQRVLNTHQTQKGTHFFRLIDPATRRVLASTEPEERGSIYDRTPALSQGEVVVDRTSDGAQQDAVINVTYLSSQGMALWMGVAPSFLSSSVIVLSAQAALLLIATFALIGFVLYLIQHTYIVKPLRTLHQALSDMHADEEDAGMPQKPPREVGALLQSFRSITQKIKNTLERDKTVSEMKSNFITTTAHQLRTPLSGINWALDSLLADKQKLDEEQAMLIEQSLEKTKELVGIVGRLLNAASIEEGKFGYHFEPTSLKSEIQEVIKEEQQMAQKYNVSVSFESSDEEFPEVRIDQERIRWVLRNLVENAIRYSDEEGEVRVWLEKAGDTLQVSVTDNGIGIPEDMQDKIFTKFFRAKNAVEKRDDGSGLGLYIARNIVTHHGGKIWFESEEGKGTTFSFTIPTQ